MAEFFTFMSAPAAGCIVLSIIFTYFGCHVLKREIVFVDLSMAQLAALGATVAFIMEIELDTPESLVISVLFVLVGGAFLPGPVPSLTESLKKLLLESFIS